MDAATAPVRRPPLLAAGLLFLLSGAAGLLYEVVWSRQCARVLGGTWAGVVVVVTAFLACLALGALLGGRVAPRLRRPLRVYALLEMGVALYALLFPALLAAASPAYGWCYRNLGQEPLLHAAARFLLTGLLLAPPTVAMGATLPILLRAVLRRERTTVLGGTGLLYGLNTVGAAAGAAATGLLLLPALGFRGTLAVGAALNLAVGAAALLLDRRTGPAAPAEPEEATAPSAVHLTPVARAALLATAAGAGLASMLHQLGWTRALILCFGSSVQAFTLVLSVFVLGLGLGGLLAPRLRASGPRLLGTIVAAEALVGIAGWWAAVRLGTLPLDVIGFVGPGVSDFGTLLRQEAHWTLAVALLPAAAMGAVFPLLVAALARGPAAAPAAAGRVYAVNTAGVVAGSLGGGFWLLPALGIRGTLLAASSLNLLLAAAVAAAVLPRRRGLPAAAALLALAAALPAATPDWPPHRLHAGAYLYAPNYLGKSRADGTTLDRTLRDLHWDMPFATEGRSAAVAVLRAPDGDLFLRVNGKTDASLVEDMDTQSLVAHLPLLLHPGPERVLVVGLATGMTAAAAATHGPRVLDVAEISPEVREAEREFRAFNGDVTRRPFVHLLQEDGRTHLEHGEADYDVIISEPTNPWIAGVSDLFTVEYFTAMKARLRPGGVAAVWLQAYGLSREEFRMILRTFLSVFPGASVWEADPWRDYLLIGPRDGVLDPAAVAPRPWPRGVAEGSLLGIGLRGPEDLLGLLFLDAPAAAAFAGEGDLHTDDRLQVEFSAPRRALTGGRGEFSPAEVEALRVGRPLPEGPGIDPVRMAAVRGGRALALEALEASRGPRDPAAGAETLLRLLQDRPRFEALLPEVPKFLREDVARGTPAEGAGAAILEALAVARGRAAFDGGQREVWSVNGLARAYMARGRRHLAAGAGRDAAEDFLRAGSLQSWNAMAPCLESVALYRLAGPGRDPALLGRALELVDLALERNPRCEPALSHRGQVLEALGRRAEAVAALEGALAVRPDSVAALGALAEVRLAAGDGEAARALLARALDLEPDNRGLARLGRLIEGR